ncbi:universal stress protein [Streptomyces daliensis]
MEVVVGVDGSAGSFAAAEWAGCAADTAARALRLVHVAKPRVGTSPWGGDGAGRMLDRLGTALAARRPGLRWSGKTLSGDPGSALAAAGDGAGLLVVGARGAGGFPGLLLGRHL